MKFFVVLLTLAFSTVTYASVDRYTNACEYANTALSTAYPMAKAALTESFDQVCGDTFCEGDYSNIASIDFSCSVETETGILRACIWTFAGSYNEIDPETGAIRVASSKVIACPIDVAGIQFDAFLGEIMASQDTVETILKGKKRSIYDQLTDCL